MGRGGPVPSGGGFRVTKEKAARATVRGFCSCVAGGATRLFTIYREVRVFTTMVAAGIVEAVVMGAC